MSKEEKKQMEKEALAFEMYCNGDIPYEVYLLYSGEDEE